MAVPVTRLVDKLGEVRAKIAALQKEETALTNTLKRKGVGTYSGLLFDAVVFKQGRTTVDWEGIIRHMHWFVPAHVLRKFTNTGDMTVCKVTSRRNRSISHDDRPSSGQAVSVPRRAPKR